MNHDLSISPYFLLYFFSCKVNISFLFLTSFPEFISFSMRNKTVAFGWWRSASSRCLCSCSTSTGGQQLRAYAAAGSRSSAGGGGEVKRPQQGIVDWAFYDALRTRTPRGKAADAVGGEQGSDHGGASQEPVLPPIPQAVKDHIYSKYGQEHAPAIIERYNTPELNSQAQIFRISHLTPF
jgi:hypothetical protein